MSFGTTIAVGLFDRLVKPKLEEAVVELVDKKWAKKDPASKDAVFDALRKLIQAGEPAGTPAFGTTEEAIDAVLGKLTKGQLAAKLVDMIKQYQRRRNITNRDGVVTKSLYRQILEDLRCPDQYIEHSDSHVRPASAGNKKAYTIRYFIDKNVPDQIQGESTSFLIKEAWAAWLLVTKYLFVDWEKKQRSRANVVIKMSQLDVLGKSKVAGPGNFDFEGLEIELDVDEPWSPDTFKGTVCYEIGHFIGFPHSSLDNQLMSEFIPRNVAAPQEEDIQRAQAIYQPSERRPARTGGIEILM